MTDPASDLSPLRWFPKTKLVPPQIGQYIYPRPQLLSSLRQAVETSRLTLISAPAGSGKTTLLTSLAGSQPDIPTAWVSLDADDNEPGVFMLLLLSSLQRIFPGFGEKAQLLFPRGISSSSEMRQAMAALINEVVEVDPGSFGLVLDDLHVITDPLILGALDYLVSHMPSCMHLLAATRHEPGISTASMRARGYLSEFHLDQLRFSQDEISDWLKDILHLDLTEKHVGLLNKQTEGWVTGLRLLTLSLEYARDKTEREAWFSRLEHGQRHVFDFLMEEIFNKQSEDVRCFLMQTSILLELTPTVCRAVTGWIAADEILEDLYRKNLFLTVNNLPSFADDSLDPELRTQTASRVSYRYHALFSEFLRAQLQRRMPEQVQELHQRAAQAESDPARAVYYYLGGELWEPACVLLEDLGRKRLGSGYLGQLVRWIQAVPQASRKAHPWLGLVLSADTIQRGHYDAAQPFLEDAYSVFQNTQDEEGMTEALTQMGEIYTCLAQTDKAQPALEQLVSRTLSSARYVKARVNQIWTAYYRGDWQTVEKEFPELLGRVQESNKTEDWFSLVLSLGPQVVYIHNGAEILESFCLSALIRDHQAIQAAARAYLGYLNSLQGRFEEARKYGDEARQTCETLGGLAHLDIFVNHVFLFDALQREDYDSFMSFLDQRLPVIAQVLTQRQFLATYLYLRALGAFRCGEKGVAAEMKARLQREQIAYEVPDAVSAHHLLDGLLAREEQDFKKAEASIRKAVDLQHTFKHSLLMTNAQADLSVLYWEMGRKDQAIQVLTPLLGQAARDHMPGLILQSGRQMLPLLKTIHQAGIQLQFVGSLLEHYESGSSTAGNTTSLKRIRLENGEYISDRELEVLRLIADGLSNQEIAARLFISAGTAKRHSINIYRKLDVKSRTQAIARAQAWHLL